ncbi:MAG: ribokinase [Acidobacteriota bacterium]|nr:ribokinase [Acidobacteriota bacterium]MDE3191029.1 ribokinase [Acidobacteriota bacterium]
MDFRSRSHPAICVVGAALIDLISYVPRLPGPGETLHGLDFRIGYGGKGANQAVMAARLGARVAMVTRVGRDTFGDGMLENFRNAGVDVTHVAVDPEAPSGVAPIAVEPGGENVIVIVTGANARMTTADVDAARGAIAAADVLVCQLEVPIEVTLAALRAAAESSTATVLNAAPALALPFGAFADVDVVCANESEAATLLGTEIEPGRELEAVRALRDLGPRAAVITLGGRGCALSAEGCTAIEPGKKVDVVDTTGAGDAFVGALACALAGGAPLAAAAARANAVAALSVTRRGTQTSFPTADEVASAPFSEVDESAG